MNDNDVTQQTSELNSEIKAATEAGTENIDALQDEFNGEVQEEKSVSPYDSLTSFEKEQYKMGWRPKELFSGDDKYWKTAELFAKDSEYFQEMNRQKRVISELQQKDKQHEQELRMVQKIAYDKAMEDLKEQRNEAIALGKFSDADRYDQQLDQIKQHIAQPFVQPPPLSSEAQQWMQQRPWMFSPNVHSVAVAKETELRALNPELNEPSRLVDLLNRVESELKVIPQLSYLFPNEVRKTEREVKTPMVESPRQTRASKPASETYFDKLDRAQQDVVLRMVKANPVPITAEEYAKKVFEFAKSKGKSVN